MSIQVAEMVRPYLTGRTFIGRGQMHLEEDMDRYGENLELFDPK